MKLKSNLLTALSLVLIFFPSGVKIPVYRWVYGYKIGRHVKIGFSWIHVGKLEIGDHVNIGSFNRFKNIPEVRIGDYSGIGTGNTFTSTDEFTNAAGRAVRGNQPMLIIGKHCGITLGHYFSVQDKFTLGDFSTIGGMSSIFFTHYVDVVTGMQSTKPIAIGVYCLITSSVRFTPGVAVPDYCVVGMGSVLTKKFSETHCLIAGNPAAVVRKLPEDAAYFHRSMGWVGPFSRAPFDVKPQ
jgi:acetyltransferase-like isoleucine patch superfamily enzyme